MGHVCGVDIGIGGHRFGVRVNGGVGGRDDVGRHEEYIYVSVEVEEISSCPAVVLCNN